MRWKTKFYLQNILSHLPLSSSHYFWLQSQFGGFKHFSIQSKVEQGISLLEALHANGLGLRGRMTAEIGTGWAPIIPMLFSFTGQSGCSTFDVGELLREDLCMQAAEQFSRSADLLAKRIPWAWGEEAVPALGIMQASRSADELLAGLQISYHTDPTNPLGLLRDASIDLFFTNDTLEHIPCEQLHPLFSEIRRILKPDGIMLHLVDCSDHYSFGDKGINRINFLRFSAGEWNRYNTRYLFQNRLRPSEFRTMMMESGFSIDYWKQKQDQRSLGELDRFPLAPEYLGFSAEDLCASSFIVIARPHNST